MVISNLYIVCMYIIEYGMKIIYYFLCIFYTFIFCKMNKFTKSEKSDFVLIPDHKLDLW